MLIRNSALYLAANGASAVLGFMGVYLYTRMLNPADFGIYIIGNTLAGIISALMFTWLRHSTVRFQSEGGSTDVRLCALTGYAGIVVAMPAVLVAIALIGNIAWQTAAIAVFISASMGLFDLGQDILRARQLAGRAMLGVIARAAIALAAGLTAISLGAGGPGLLVALSCAYLAAACLLAPSTWRTPLAPLSRTTLLQMLRFGGPITVSGFIFALHTGLDRLMIGSILGTEAAGQYGASADFVRQCMIYPAISASAAIGPMAIQLLAEHKTEQLNAHLARSAELLLAVVLPAAIGIAVVSQDLSSFVLGPQFRDAGASLMPIFAMSWVAFVVAHHYVHLSFSLANRPTQYIVHAACTLAISATLMYPMISRFGLQGAAATLLIAECISALIGMYMTRANYTLPIPIRRLLRIICAVAIMTAVTLTVQQLMTSTGLVRLISVTSAGVASYFIAAVTLNILNCRPAVLQLINRLGARVRLV
jgi:O-antigen/teichoic acid export membrane protein